MNAVLYLLLHVCFGLQTVPVQQSSVVEEEAAQGELLQEEIAE